MELVQAHPAPHRELLAEHLVTSDLDHQS